MKELTEQNKKAECDMAATKHSARELAILNHIMTLKHRQGKRGGANAKEKNNIPDAV